MSILPICITGSLSYTGCGADRDSVHSELSDLVADMTGDDAAPGVGLRCTQVASVEVREVPPFDSHYRDVLQSMREGAALNTALSGVVVVTSFRGDTGGGRSYLPENLTWCESEGCLSVLGYGWPAVAPRAWRSCAATTGRQRRLR